jgi:hypothetical protein
MGLMPQKEGVMEIGHVGLAVMAWLMIVSFTGAVVTAVVTQWDM